MKPPAFPARAAAALFIERQHLGRPRGRRLTARALEALAADTGGLQLDSINVLERAHYLTAWNRFGAYDRRALDRLAYGRRVLFEHWAHAACLVATSELPAWRRAMLDYRVRHTGWSKWLRKHGRTMKAVEDAIRERGPLANADFQHDRPRGAPGWWNWKPAAHALHYLWMTGRIMVHSRVHFQKRYDLAERIVPGLAEVAPLEAAEFRRWHIRRSLHAMGAATELDLSRYLTFPRIVPGLRRASLRAMLAAGEVVEVAVEGRPGRWLALAEDLPALAAAARRRTVSRGTALLAPFDSFLWHRDRTSRLFGFDYRIEVYTPGHKRTFGYYTLPILHDGQLIGRLDAKTHREARHLEVRSVHFERWFAAKSAPPPAAWHREGVEIEPALAGIAEALRSLAAFVGADRVTLGRVVPTRLKPPLQRALRETAAPPALPRAPEPEVAEAIAADDEQAVLADEPLEQLGAVAELPHRGAHVGAHRVGHEAVRIAGAAAREQRLDRGPHPVHDRAQVARLGRRVSQQLLERRRDRAALRVAHDHDQAGAVARGRELDAPHLRGRHHVARDPNHEQVAKALVEHQLGGHARVRAAQHDRERLLPSDQGGAIRVGRRGGRRRPVGHEPAVAFAQPRQRLGGRNHAGVSTICGVSSMEAPGTMR